MPTPTLAEFNSENSDRPFVVFDRIVGEYWKEGGFTRNIKEATIYNNGLNSQEEVDAAYKGCSLHYV